MPLLPPRPALVTADAARRLPRIALILLAAAWLLPGFFGRDPWRGQDLESFALMLSLAEGRTAWTQPGLGLLPSSAPWLPLWLGAAAIRLGQGWLEPALAARIPFLLLAGLVLTATWYAAYHLARGRAAQPLPFAFGGEATPVAYARAIADAALLALMATLGLQRLGHETTPELAQLAAMAALLWAVAHGPEPDDASDPLPPDVLDVPPSRVGWASRLGVLATLPLLAACGAPTMALLMGLGLLGLTLTGRAGLARSLAPWIAAGMGFAALAAWPLHGWAWRGHDVTLAQLVKQWAWFLWPSGPLAAWTLWRWRQHLLARHIVLPLLSFTVALLASIAMGGHDRALMLGLPGLAVLASFALPTLSRAASSAIDWFSVIFFTLAALTFWVLTSAMLTGVPARPAANVARLTEGFQLPFQPAALLLGVAATVAWVALVRWRTAQHRPALWKPLVLSAGGITLAWLLLMTVWLPALDHARSNRPLATRLEPFLGPQGQCVAAPEAPISLIAALEVHGRRRIDARREAMQGPCPVLVTQHDDDQGDFGAALMAHTEAAGWREIARVRRPSDRHEWTLVWQRRSER